jgi:WD40-like Beta Propeller Repeat
MQCLTFGRSLLYSAKPVSTWRRSSDDSSDDFWPAWSPDGSRIALSRWAEGEYGYKIHVLRRLFQEFLEGTAGVESEEN